MGYKFYDHLGNSIELSESEKNTPEGCGKSLRWDIRIIDKPYKANYGIEWSDYDVLALMYSLSRKRPCQIGNLVFELIGEQINIYHRLESNIFYGPLDNFLIEMGFTELFEKIKSFELKY